jgi:Arc/MetJ-type ribon-helix-helix transcriptional regulator
MSSLVETKFLAVQIRAEETINKVLARINRLRVLPEVKQKIIDDYQIEKALKKLRSMSYYTNDYSDINEVKRGVTAFFSTIDTYIAYNYDLEKTTYDEAMKKAAEAYAGACEARNKQAREAVEQALASTKDELFKAYIRSAIQEGTYASAGEVLAAAREKMSKSGLYKSRTAKNLKLILKEAEIPLHTCFDDVSELSKIIAGINEKSLDAEIDKAVRNRVLAAIIKIIKDQGFTVRKENVEELGDHAKISAIKPNGERVDFTVYLDGKFAYKFHKYEGMSCERDIGNFEEQFESIYGIKLEEKTIVWSNPDRLAKSARRINNARSIGG